MQADPARDLRDDVAQASGVTEFDDKIWFHRTAAAVIEPDRCIGCGACVAACPSGSIGIGDDGQPTLVRMCTGCSFCWDFCPMAGLRPERIEPAAENGVLASYAARAASEVPGAQDGGAATTILESLIARGVVDGVLLTKRSGAFRGEPEVVTTVEGVRQGAGSVYHQGFPLAALSGPLPEGVSSLAFVGTPCQISALRAMQRSPWRYRRDAASAVTVTIALFCTRSFDPIRLMGALARRQVPLRDVQRIDIRDGVLSADIAGERRDIAPVREFGDAALRGCDECTDFTGRLADISLGNLGSEIGWTSVLIRTERGAEVWDGCIDALDVRGIGDLDRVRRSDRSNRRRALRVAPQPEHEDAHLRYTEHVRLYAGTERAAQPAPPHRSHHYRQSC